MEARQNYLFLEQAKGYVNALEKSTSAPSTMREVFELCAERLGRRKNRHVSLPESQPLSRPSRRSGKAVREESGLRAGHTVRYGRPLALRLGLGRKYDSMPLGFSCNGRVFTRLPLLGVIPSSSTLVVSVLCTAARSAAARPDVPW